MKNITLSFEIVLINHILKMKFDETDNVMYQLSRGLNSMLCSIMIIESALYLGSQRSTAFNEPELILQ